MNPTLRRWLVPAIVIAVVSVVILAASHATGPAFDELDRMSGVDRAKDLIVAVARSGPSAFSAPAAGNAYKASFGHGTLPTLLSAWALLGPARHGFLDPLIAYRFGWLVAAALGPIALYVLVRPSFGGRVAALSSALLLVMPRFLHEAALASESAVVASLTLSVVACYVRGRAHPARKSRTVCWAFAGAAFLGVAAAVHLAVLWAVPFAVLHLTLSSRGSTRAALAGGRLPMPGFVLTAVIVLPIVFLAAEPALWNASPRGLVTRLLAPLGASIEPTVYRGDRITQLPVPAGFAAHYLMAAVPLPVLALALVGLSTKGLAHFGRRVAAHPSTSDPLAITLLAVLAVVLAVVGPALVPDMLTHFPPRTLGALPFIAFLGALGLETIARRFFQGRRADGFVVVATAVLAWLGTIDLSTASAAYSYSVGGPARVARAETFVVRDGSELAVVAPALNARADGDVAVAAPGVPADYWKRLRDVGRLDSVVRAGRGRAAIEIAAEPRPGAAAAATYQGVVLWSLAVSD